MSAFNPLPWQVEAWRDKSPIVLLTGSAGGGKSRLAAEKLHGFCLRYPGAMALMLRKTRSSMTNSTVLFMERRVIAGGARHMPSKSRFEYANGSILAYGGMADEQQREQVRSIGQDGGLDIAWMEEAHMFSHQDYQEILPRMRGKAAAWAQLLLSTNPDSPQHWINQKLIVGQEASIHRSSAADNFHNPKQYIEWLGKLTGVQYQRLVLGLWVQAEGAIYPTFDMAGNATEAAEYAPNKGNILWGCDNGYAYGEGPGTVSYHPRVILLAQKNEWGGPDIFGEIIVTGEAEHETIDRALKELDYPKPELAYVDNSAQVFMHELQKRGIFTRPGNDSGKFNVANGIANVRRLIGDEKNQRILRIHPRCTQLISELQSYSYDPASKQVSAGEPKPLKINDDTPDALRYLCRHFWYSR